MSLYASMSERKIKTFTSPANEGSICLTKRMLEEGEVEAFARKRSATREKLYSDTAFLEQLEQEAKASPKVIERRRGTSENTWHQTLPLIDKLEEEQLEQHFHREFILRICETEPYHGLPDSLPEELWLLVFEMLGYRELCAMTCVCHTFRRIGRDELLNPVVRFKKKKEEALRRFWAGKEAPKTK